MSDNTELLTINEASEWATQYLDKNVTPSNISYLIQYGRIQKVEDYNFTRIRKNELVDYYKDQTKSRKEEWKKQLGHDLNWALSFEEYKEAETTKHVHRLHPYKGKFIPQLVEYFLDTHTDSFKTETFFQKNDIVLDPFSGSGTTMVQANELGLHAIGIDISEFNSLIANSKVQQYDFSEVEFELHNITCALKDLIKESHVIEFEEKLLQELYVFNNEYFPVPDYKYKVYNKLIDEKKYGEEKEKEFLVVFNKLVKDFDIKIKQTNNTTFLDVWFFQNVRKEIDFVLNQIEKIQNKQTKDIISIILSRTIRSCRATTHADLATLKEPVVSTYYCSKHGKICKPLFSILKWWESYTKDTVKRLKEFSELRTNTFQTCLTGDSRVLNIFEEIQKNNESFGEIVQKQKIKGIFSSPPYVGLIDYHEQHAYAYDMFKFERKDNLEIGPLFKGKGIAAQESYVEGVAAVLNNCKKYLVEAYDVFLVANDRNNLYPRIATKAGMEIINTYKRPVLNRTEKDRGAYSEIIFHLREKQK